MKFVLVSHGSYSTGILESVQMLVGQQEDLVAFSLLPDEPTSALAERLLKEINKTDNDILFFTDLFHGSPFNVVVSLMKDHNIYHITGINLPLMVEAIMKRNMGVPIDEICDSIISLAPETIVDVKKFLDQEV
ncbi:MAG: PTS sugar transporter subunit IIA [Eubacterium sp.]